MWELLPTIRKVMGKWNVFMVRSRKNALKKALLDQDHAKIIIGSYIAFFNNQRLHSTNAYITPADQLAGRDNKIHEERRKKIHVARLKRKHNVLRDEIKLNKLEHKLASQKLYSYQL